MKKIITTILTLALLSTCLMGVSAVESTTDVKVEHSGAGLDGTSTGTVTVNVVSSPVYLINITWDSLAFEYKFDTWNTGTHKFTGNSGWQAPTTRNVKLVNHSNAEVNYTAEFNGTSSDTSSVVKGVTAKLSKISGKLYSAVGTTPSDAPNDTFEVSVSGEPTSTQGENFTVDTITIKLS